ncbi:FAD dependent oxidoreductase [Gloeopeniophorella convolvens]|nr:FAD dependent oxidoreductase [Gloeopeniophorella convolvens]
MSISKDDSILIVGAGCFGISTAHHLLQRGYTNITVLDRSETLPAPDAASTDLNKVVRTSYSDFFYSQLARDAIQEWKKTDEWDDIYKESGVLVLGALDEHPYAARAHAHDTALGLRTTQLPPGAPVRSAFPPGARPGAVFDRSPAYLNADSGWAAAARGVARLTERVRVRGARVLAGTPVAGLLREGGRTVGVRLARGGEVRAARVVLATGAWTASVFRELEGLGERCRATGQTVATVQLTDEEAARYRAVPVVLDFRTGFYVFPPNDDNIVKFAIHESGVVHYPSASPTRISTPRTAASHGATEGLRVPRSTLRRLRAALRDVYPELADKPFASTRLCWRVSAHRYTDSPDGDWAIGPYPDDAGLVLATAGSGHAYKVRQFLPVIGRLVADALEGTLEPALVAKFAVGRAHGPIDEWRGRLAPADLAAEALSTPEDLLP